MDELVKQGTAIVETLSVQQAQLHSVEEGVHQIEYDRAIAVRLLRSMTWFGWFINLFTREPLKKIKANMKPDIPHENDDPVDQLLSVSKTMNEQLKHMNQQIYSLTIAK